MLPFRFHTAAFFPRHVILPEHLHRSYSTLLTAMETHKMKRSEKAIVAALGAALPTLPPVISALFAADVPGAQTIEVGTMATLIIAYFLSIFITVKLDCKHIYECLISSLGLPGVVIALAVGAQGLS